MSPTKPHLRLCTRCQAVHSEKDRVWAKCSYIPVMVSHCPHCGSTIHTSVPPEKRQLMLPFQPPAEALVRANYSEIAEGRIAA